MTNTVTCFQYDLTFPTFNSNRDYICILTNYSNRIFKKKDIIVCTSTDLKQQCGCNIDRANDANSTYCEGMKL